MTDTVFTATIVDLKSRENIIKEHFGNVIVDFAIADFETDYEPASAIIYTRKLDIYGYNRGDVIAVIPEATTISYSELDLKAKVKAMETLLPKPTPYLEVMQTTWYLYDKERGVI